MGELTQQISKKLEYMACISAVVAAFMLPLSTTFTDVFMLLAVVLMLAAGNWRNKFQQIMETRVALMVLALFAMFIIGVFYSSAPNNDAMKMLLKDSKLLYAVFLLPVFVEKRWRTYAINAFLAAMLLTLLLTYLKAYGVIDFNPRYGHMAVFKSYIQTNYMMAFTAYILILLAWFERRHYWLYGSLLILILYNVLFLSHGRSGYIVLAALVGLCAWQTMRWRGLAYGVLALTVLFGATFMLSNTFRSRMLEIGQDAHHYSQGNTRTSVGLRMEFTKNSLELIKKNPIIGTGTGSFAHEYMKTNAASGIQSKNPHNEYINFAVQFGAVGLLLLLLVFYSQWRDSFYLPKKMSFISQAVVLSIALGCLANSWLMDTMEGHFYAYFMALTFAALPRKKVEGDESE